MRILLFTSVAGNGGSAATAFQTARLLKAAGQQAVLVAPGEYWAGRGKTEGVPVRSDLELRRGFRGLSFWRDFRKLRRYLQAEPADALIVQKSPEQWLAFLVLRSLSRKAALVRMRGVVFPIRPSLFNRWLHNSMDLILCSAQCIARQYEGLDSFRTGHVKVLHEGIDTQRFVPAMPDERLAARKKFGLKEDALYLGTAGRPSPVKGHDLLVRAFAKALDECGAKILEQGLKSGLFPRLCIFSDESRRGPGSYGNLEGLCRELGIQDRVDLRSGFVEDMREVYRALDVYVLPSRGSEGSSRAGLEASASGLPLIASSVGVLPDLVEDGKTGRLAPPDNESELVKVLVELLSTWPKALAWGREARRRMEERFNEKKYVSELIKSLQQAKERSN